MMAQNCQSKRDRSNADEDCKSNVKAKKEIEELLAKLNLIEIEKLNKILALLIKMDAKSQ